MQLGEVGDGKMDSAASDRLALPGGQPPERRPRAAMVVLDEGWRRFPGLPRSVSTSDHGSRWRRRQRRADARRAGGARTAEFPCRPFRAPAVLVVLPWREEAGGSTTTRRACDFPRSCGVPTAYTSSEIGLKRAACAAGRYRQVRWSTMSSSTRAGSSRFHGPAPRSPTARPSSQADRPSDEARGDGRSPIYATLELYLRVAPRSSGHGDPRPDRADEAQEFEVAEFQCCTSAWFPRPDGSRLSSPEDLNSRPDGDDSS